MASFAVFAPQSMKIFSRGDLVFYELIQLNRFQLNYFLGPNPFFFTFLIFLNRKFRFLIKTSRTTDSCDSISLKTSQSVVAVLNCFPAAFTAQKKMRLHMMAPSESIAKLHVPFFQCRLRNLGGRSTEQRRRRLLTCDCAIRLKFRTVPVQKCAVCAISIPFLLL